MPRSTTAKAPAVEDADRMARLEERLAELEDRERASAAELAEDAVERMIGRIMPPDARTHLRAARKEQLLAVRSFIDHWIERLDRPPEPRRRTRRPARTPRRRESIPLE